jgi:hypothetical protein
VNSRNGEGLAPAAAGNEAEDEVHWTGSSSNASPNATQDIDRVAEIERLAALDAINYEVARTKAAVRLKVRASVLDREVAKKRRALGLETDQDDDGQGRAVKIANVLPWTNR